MYKPNDSIKWEKYSTTCDNCGAEVERVRVYSHYFYTLDGWDCMDWKQCENCERDARNAARRAKRKREREAKEWAKKLAESLTANGVEVTEEKYKELLEFCRR